MSTIIRPEQAGDEQAIHDITTAAFEPMPYSAGTEAAIVAGLREDGDLTVSLVAVDGLDVVGHAAFSPLSVEAASGEWYALGPLSVRPDRQRQGIGSALLREGLEMLRAKGASGCVLVGDPDYYGRFGFKSGGVGYREVPARFVQWLAFAEDTPSGALTFSPAFER